jgi:hypothetical protein
MGAELYNPQIIPPAYAGGSDRKIGLPNFPVDNLRNKI